MKIKENLEAVNALRNENSKLKNEMSEMRIVVDDAIRGMQEEKVNNDINHSTLEELNEKVGRMSEEKMKMEIENAKRIEVLELSKKMAEDERLSQQELARETIRELEETISVQKQQHVSSTEASKELLESMEGKLCAREKELDDIKVKCTEKEEKLDDCEDKIIMLSKERENDKTEMEEKIKLLSTREEEANEMIRRVMKC